MWAKVAPTLNSRVGGDVVWGRVDGSESGDRLRSTSGNDLLGDTCLGKIVVRSKGRRGRSSYDMLNTLKGLLFQCLDNISDRKLEALKPAFMISSSYPGFCEFG